MQYYLEILPEYQQSPVAAGQKTEQYDSEQASPGGAKSSSAQQQLTAANFNKNNSSALTSMQAAFLGQMGDLGMKDAIPKTPVDATKAAANLQKASDLQRQKFMDVFTQMQATSPAVAAQKTYKVKSDSKQPQSGLLKPENPFSTAIKQSVVGLLDDSPSEDTQGPPEGDFEIVAAPEVKTKNNFHPFETPVAKPVPVDPSIFEKMIQPEPIVAASKTTLVTPAIVSKVEQRKMRKKGGRKVYVTTTVNDSDVPSTNGLS